MTQFSSSEIRQHFSPAASLAALGLHLRQIDLFGPICDTVKIAQKSVKYSPLDKLNDAFISILPTSNVSSIGQRIPHIRANCVVSIVSGALLR